MKTILFTLITSCLVCSAFANATEHVEVVRPTRDLSTLIIKSRLDTFQSTVSEVYDAVLESSRKSTNDWRSSGLVSSKSEGGYVATFTIEHARSGYQLLENRNSTLVTLTGVVAEELFNNMKVYEEKFPGHYRIVPTTTETTIQSEGITCIRSRLVEPSCELVVEKF